MIYKTVHDLLESYDYGEIGVSDIADIIENECQDSPDLISLVSAYRTEERENFTLYGGRNDMESAEDCLIAGLRAHAEIKLDYCWETVLCATSPNTETETPNPEPRTKPRTKPEPPTLLIEISGGLVSVYIASQPIKLIVVDHDNVRAGDSLDLEPVSVDSDLNALRERLTELKAEYPA